MIRAWSAQRRAKGACLALGVAGAAFGLFTGPAAAADSCPNAAVRAQQHATALPECRAYELVNPGTDDVGEVNRMPWASDDGNVMTYMSIIPGDDALGGGVAAISVARRTSGGWTSKNADPSSTGAIGIRTGLTYPKAFSTDFSRALLITSLPMSSDDVDYQEDIFRVNVGLGTGTLMTLGVDSGVESVPSATPDLSKVLFRYTDGGSLGNGLYLSDGNVLESIGGPYPDGNQDLGTPSVAGAGFERGPGVPGRDLSAVFAEHVCAGSGVESEADDSGVGVVAFG
jgi:hypothetical protein